jgi:hypothetical protein
MPRTHDGGPATLEAPSAQLNSIPRFSSMQPLWPLSQQSAWSFRGLKRRAHGSETV